MNKWLGLGLMAGALGIAGIARGEEPMKSIYDFTMRDIDPLYTFLTSEEAHPKDGGAISWNFNKFLVGRDGSLLEHFGSRTTPEDPELVAAVEQALQAAN